MRSWLLVAGAALLGVAFVGVLRLPGLSDAAVLLLSDGGQLLAATLAAVGCALAVRRTHGQRRRAWWWLSLGSAGWAAGQLVWSYYEIVLDRGVPFPSLSDVGFLVFPLASAVGLVIWLGSQVDQIAARGRDVLDGAIIAGSLLVVSWVTALGSVVSEGGDGWLPLTLSLAYPITDLVLATLVLLALARGSGSERATLAVLALGLGGLSVSDSAYVYLVSTERYSSADLISSGWVIGFLLVGVAGLTVRADTAAAPRQVPGRTGPVVAKPSMLRLLLPYIPLVAAVAALVASRVAGPVNPTANLALGAALILLVLVRQFLAVADNQRLLVALAEVRDQLEQQALHDALTGLANRVLFADRLDMALLQPGAHVSVLFCDLDDFKLVNDELGHEAGDVLLRQVALRLRECVRATDTVARLGGDEFAILLDDDVEAMQVADRVVAAMREPIDVQGQAVRTSISVGIARHQGTAPVVEHRHGPESRRRNRVPNGAVHLPPAAHREATAQLLLRYADSAMYAAKGAGKSRAVLADAVIGGPTTPAPH